MPWPVPGFLPDSCVEVRTLTDVLEFAEGLVFHSVVEIKESGTPLRVGVSLMKRKQDRLVKSALRIFGTVPEVSSPQTRTVSGLQIDPFHASAICRTNQCVAVQRCDVQDLFLLFS